MRGEALSRGIAGLSTDCYERYFGCALRVLIRDVFRSRTDQRRNSREPKRRVIKQTAAGPLRQLLANLHQTKQLLTEPRAWKN